MIKEIIEDSYKIGDYVEKFEAYKEQMKSANLLQSITSLMIPEFKEFIAKKFEQMQKPGGFQITETKNDEQEKKVESKPKKK